MDLNQPAKVPKPEVDLSEVPETRSGSRPSKSRMPRVIRSSAPEVFLRGKCGLRIEIPEGRFAKQISVVDSKREDLIRRSKAPELGH
jgi:hypothetical protein